MAASPLQKLQQLQHLARQLEYEADMLKKSPPDRPFDILSIRIDEDKVEEGRQLELVYYPENADLEGSDFLQFYCHYPFVYNDEGLQKIKQLLPDVNNRMSLGHFGISFNEKKVQFKYVLALPLKTEVKPLFFKDVLEICIYTPPLFHDIIHQAGTAQISIEAAIRQLRSV